MRALSIRQPWAWLIVRPDLVGAMRKTAIANNNLKIIENRTWPTKFRGRFLIHAAAGMTRAEYQAVYDSTFPLPPFEKLQRGGIVGEANLVDCIAPDSRTSKWHMPGHYGFLLADVEPLPFRTLKGKLQFFEVPA